jgi:sulfite exporter TauE/SafE
MDTLPLIGAVFLASLLGSTHCAGMCGGFLLFAIGADDPGRGWRTALQVAYNAGRLLSYATLGAIAGAVGSALDLSGEAMLGVQRVAAAGAGALILAFGIVTLCRELGVGAGRFKAPSAMVNLTQRVYRAASGLGPIKRAAAVGLSSALLPCGWLYAFVAASAGTGSPLVGAVTMAVFWAGTLPMMATLGAGVQLLAGPLRARLPLITAAALVIVGVATVTGRLAIPVQVNADLIPASDEPALFDAPCHNGPGA